MVKVDMNKYGIVWHHIDGFVQDSSISSALAVESLQSYTKPSICTIVSSYITIWIYNPMQEIIIKYL